MLPAAVWTAADLDGGLLSVLGHLGTFGQRVGQLTTKATRLRDRELARFGSRAAGHVRNRRCPWAPEPGGGKTRIELGHARLRHPPQKHVLVRREANRAVAKRARQRRQNTQLS